jgi:hypothetical protein
MTTISQKYGNHPMTPCVPTLVVGHAVCMYAHLAPSCCQLVSGIIYSACSNNSSVSSLSKVTARKSASSSSLRNISEHHSCTSVLLLLHISDTANPPMEVVGVSSTEPSLDQLLRKRGKSRGWRSRGKGIVYDPAKQSLEIHRVKEIERSSRLPACGIYTGNMPNV